MTYVSPASLRFTIDADISQSRIAVLETSGNEARLLHTFSLETAAPSLQDLLPMASRIVALDVLEHVVDEEHLLQAMAERLVPGGEMVVRVPVEGRLTWLDALNLYRYMQDVTGLGKRLEETKMKGWHRHYRPEEVARMLRAAGLAVGSVQRSGSPHLDVVQFGALAWGTVVRHDEDVERRLMSWRDRAESSADLPRFGPASTKVTLTATKSG